MEAEEWLVGWRDIGNYIKKSAKTAQRYTKDGMPFSVILEECRLRKSL